MTNPGVIEVKEKPSKSGSEATRSYKTVLKKGIYQYLQSTSLHGLKFIADSNLSQVERSFFLIAFILSLLTSSYYISVIYNKWHSTPLLITISSTSTSISAIPFPGITICNLNHAKRSLVKNIQPNMSDYANLQILCKNERIAHILDNNETESWDRLRDFILKVSPPCEELLVSCRYGSVETPCLDMFEPILTDEGLCCTYNNVHPDFLFTELSRGTVVAAGGLDDIPQPVRWTPEAGFQKNLPDQYYPRRAIGTGVNLGLTVVINSSNNDYYCSSSRSFGFKMFLHSPIEMPKIMNYGFLLSPGLETQVAITLQLHNSANNIRRIRRAARHCVFEGEIKLRYYQTYTKRNCELECESLLMEEKCGCVTYYLPRVAETSIVCGLKDFDCVSKVRYEVEALQDEDGGCSQCLPSCISLNYLPVTSSTELHPNDFAFMGDMPPKGNANLREMAVVHFFYEYNTFRARMKEEFLGFADFLANSGGILSLFLGFSMLSVIEFLYFLISLPHSMAKTYIRKKKDSSEPVNGRQSIRSPNYLGSREVSVTCPSSIRRARNSLAGSRRNRKSGRLDTDECYRKRNRTKTKLPLPYCE